MANFKSLNDLELKGRTVLLRADLNVPMTDGKVSDTTRILSVIPTLKALIGRGAKILVLSHFDRPKGKVVPEMSLRPLAGPLGQALGKPVYFIDDCIGVKVAEARAAMCPGEVALLENVRFYPGEETNDPGFARDLAANADAYVDDAFSCAHRAHASTEGIAHILPAAAGLAMKAELEALEVALGNPRRPVAAVVGGAKISTKLDVLNHLVEKVDHLIIGGGMANTFLAAKGVAVGKSLCEHDLGEVARTILASAEKAGCAVHLPTDVVVAKAFKAGAACRTLAVAEVGADDMILDIGRETVTTLIHILEASKTLVWNGPMGAFEIAPFDKGTVALAKAAAKLSNQGLLLTVAGGGDTVAALHHAGVARDFTHISTAGGAFLEWMEGKDLPGVSILKS